MVIVLSKTAHDAKNASVPKQTTGLSDITVDGVDSLARASLCLILARSSSARTFLL